MSRLADLNIRIIYKISHRENKLNDMSVLQWVNRQLTLFSL